MLGFVPRPDSFNQHRFLANESFGTDLLQPRFPCIDVCRGYTRRRSPKMPFCEDRDPYTGTSSFGEHWILNLMISTRTCRCWYSQVNLDIRSPVLKHSWLAYSSLARPRSKLVSASHNIIPDGGLHHANRSSVKPVNNDNVPSNSSEFRPPNYRLMETYL